MTMTNDGQRAQDKASVPVPYALSPVPCPLSPVPFLLLLAVFALYAPALGVALLHDDAANAFWLQPQHWANLFTFDAAAGGAAARPLANALWLLTRDLFGWFSPPIIHAWNIWLHVLNTALVYALARQSGNREWGMGISGQEFGSALHSLSPIPYSLFPLCAAALFAFFPFHYQPVIWAGSIYHPVLLACGLSGLLASLRGRWGIAALGALGALLAHEGGFVFALIIAALHVATAWRTRRPLRAPALAIGALGIAYPLLFRFVLGAARFAGDAPNALHVNDLWPNTLYFLQGFVWFASALLRPIIGLTPDWPAWIVGAFVVGAALGLALAARARMLPLALGALAAWALLVAPAIVGLDRQYVVNGPRLHYSASVAVALFWSAAALGIGNGEWGMGNGEQPARIPIPYPLFPIPFLLIACLPSILFVREALNESLAVSRTMFTVNDALRELPASARVLYVNAPWYSRRTSPRFLVGSEGMPIYQHDGTFPSTWIGAQSNTLRETHFVRHDISLTHGEVWGYGSPGEIFDDAALAAQVLAVDDVWRWDYDAPGVRARRVAQLERGAPPPSNAAPDGVSITHADAQRCDDRILLTIDWYIAQPPTEPTGVMVHGFAADDTQLFNADANPFGGLVPFTALPARTRLRETREIRLDPHAPAPHHIALGLYHSVDFAAVGVGLSISVGSCRR